MGEIYFFKLTITNTLTKNKKTNSVSFVIDSPTRCKLLSRCDKTSRNQPNPLAAFGCHFSSRELVQSVCRPRGPRDGKFGLDPAGCLPESVAWGTVGWLVTGDLLWTSTPLHQMENSTLPPPAGMQTARTHAHANARTLARTESGNDC